MIIVNLIVLQLVLYIVKGVNVKNEDKNIIQDNIEYNMVNIDCIPIEECHQCSFEELKTESECYKTGYKKRNKCINLNNIEIYNIESCNENIGINSVYIMLFICILIFISAWKIQKNYKDSFMKNIFQKISIFKKEYDN